MQLRLFNVDSFESQSEIVAPKSQYQNFKFVNNYRKSDGAESCKSCINLYICPTNGKNYYKCTLLGFSHSAATDIRLCCICDRYHSRTQYNLPDVI